MRFDALPNCLKRVVHVRYFGMGNDPVKAFFSLAAKAGRARRPKIGCQARSAGHGSFPSSAQRDADISSGVFAVLARLWPRVLRRSGFPPCGDAKRATRGATALRVAGGSLPERSEASGPGGAWREATKENFLLSGIFRYGGNAHGLPLPPGAGPFQTLEYRNPIRKLTLGQSDEGARRGRRTQRERCRDAGKHSESKTT